MAAGSFYIPPPAYGAGPTSLGSLEDIARAQLAADATSATQTQAGQLVSARLAALSTPEVGAIPQMPVNMATAADLPQMMMPRALGAGTAPLNGPAIPMGPSGAFSSNAATAESTLADPLRAASAARAPGPWNAVMNDAAAVSGGARAPISAAEQLAGGTGLGEAATGLGEAATGAAGGGLFSAIGGKLAAAGVDSPLLTKALGAAEAHPGLARGLAGIGLILGGEYGGKALGSGKPVGDNSVLGSVVEHGAKAAGEALMVPGIGVIAAPIAGIVGGAYGAVAGPLSDYYAVQHYDHFTNQFVNLAKGYAGDDQNDARKKFGAAAMKIHDGPGSVMDKALQLQQLTAAMQKYQDNGYKLDTSNGQQTAGARATAAANEEAKSNQRLAIQMGQAMGQLSQDYKNQGAAMADMQRQAAVANPSLAPVLNADAASRQAYAAQMGDAFTAAAYITPTINRMNQQISQQQQLLQSIYAAQYLSNQANNGGSATSLSALTNPKQQAAQQLAGAGTQVSGG